MTPIDPKLAEGGNTYPQHRKALAPKPGQARRGVQVGVELVDPGRPSVLQRRRQVQHLGGEKQPAKELYDHKLTADTVRCFTVELFECASYRNRATANFSTLHTFTAMRNDDCLRETGLPLPVWAKTKNADEHTVKDNVHALT